ncbi:MAG: nitroreductase family protein, partial [Candidatus Omnitrophica bacterium]|nr:nitroreductase family protein [Candidatus Omnitrophota bacterium]
QKDLIWLGEIAPNGKFIKDAAAAIIVFCEDTKYYLEDGCAATENILLAAAALGLGACWVAGDKKDYSLEVCKYFGAPQNYKLVSMISLGYPQSEPAGQPKKALSEILHRGKL